MWWVYALLSAVFAAATAILAKLGVKDVNSNLATAIRTTVVLILSWGIVGAQGNLSQTFSLSRSTVLFLIASGIATGLSWLAYFKALQLAEVSHVAPIDKSSLALTVLLAAVVLGEILTWKTLLGSALILIGTLVIIL
jgi:bacterial/archaeal transporter family protein